MQSTYQSDNQTQLSLYTLQEPQSTNMSLDHLEEACQQTFVFYANIVDQKAQMVAKTNRAVKRKRLSAKKRRLNQLSTDENETLSLELCKESKDNLKVFIDRIEREKLMKLRNIVTAQMINNKLFVAKASQSKYENLNKAIALILYENGNCQELIDFLKVTSFDEKNHVFMQELWCKSHYRLSNRDCDKAVVRYRLRKKHYYPRTIWNGEDTKYGISERQNRHLQSIFIDTPKPNKNERERIASNLNLNLKQVSNWFKNRRQRRPDKISSNDKQSMLPEPETLLDQTHHSYNELSVVQPLPDPLPLQLQQASQPEEASQPKMLPMSLSQPVQFHLPLQAPEPMPLSQPQLQQLHQSPQVSQVIQQSQPIQTQQLALPLIEYSNQQVKVEQNYQEVCQYIPVQYQYVEASNIVYENNNIEVINDSPMMPSYSFEKFQGNNSSYEPITIDNDDLDIDIIDIDNMKGIDEFYSIEAF